MLREDEDEIYRYGRIGSGRVMEKDKGSDSVRGRQSQSNSETEVVTETKTVTT